MKLTAIKSLRYGTRRMQPGDNFEARDRDAKILIAVRKARAYEDRTPGKLPAPPAGLVERFAEDLTAVRQAYFEKMGRRPFHKWDAAELRRRMA